MNRAQYYCEPIDRGCGKQDFERVICKHGLGECLMRDAIYDCPLWIEAQEITVVSRQSKEEES